MADVKKEVESLLFASGRAMTAKDLADIIQARIKDVENAIREIKAGFDSRDTSLTLMETADGWKMNVKEQYVSLVTKIVADTELPFPLLETLSVIAYKAPAWQAEVVKTRGTNAYEHIQQLIDAGFVDRRKKGRSFELVLTPKFFEYFDVPGEKNLKMMFQDVKPSEPSPRIKKSLGSLPVVDIPEGQKAVNDDGEPVSSKEKLGGLEVVKIPAHQEQFKPDDEFLDKIESRIEDVSKRNDEYDGDDLFRKPDTEGGLPPENSPAEGGLGDNSQDAPNDNDSGGETEKEEQDEATDEPAPVEDPAPAEDETEIKPKDPLAEDEDKVEI